jgi:polyisoprenoid-binding protein YceI
MSRRLKLLACAIVLVIALGGAGLWWFLRDDAPASVDLDTAVESVQPADGSTTAAATDGVDGTWTVDAETGDFDYESATGTFAGFRVDEELSSIGSTTAVGRTGDVTGEVEIDGTTLSAATFDIDLTTITTNERRRDDKVQEALDTGEHPTARFTLTEPIDLGDAASTGDTVEVTATGDLTIHGVTRQVEIPLEAQLVNDTVVVVGSLDLTFSDYDVEVPQSPIVLSVDDQGTLELQLLLTRA